MSYKKHSEPKKWAGQTRWLETNICNLAYGTYEGAGKYDIPILEPVSVPNLADIPIQGFNFALNDNSPEGKGVHFFLHDYQFERVWKYPDRYTDFLSKFEFVLSPDFSCYSDTPLAVRIYNTYRNRWCARYWQENGLTVIPTVTWSDDETFEFCLDGLPKHSTIAVSTMGEGRYANWESLQSHWQEMLDKIEPDMILLYGKDLRTKLNGNIVHKKLISSKVAITERS